MRKLTEGYHPAYLCGYNDCIDEMNYSSKEKTLEEVLSSLPEAYLAHKEYNELLRSNKGRLDFIDRLYIRFNAKCAELRKQAEKTSRHLFLPLETWLHTDQD